MTNYSKLYAEHIGHKLKVYCDAMAQAGLNRVVIASGAVGYRFRDDINLPYMANPYYNEFLPLSEHPNSFLVIEEGHQPILHLQHHDDFWHSEPEALATEFAEQFDIKEYVNQPDMRELEGAAYIGADLAQLPDSIAGAVVQNPEQLLYFIDYHRAWKTDYEQLNLREANQKAVLGHKAAEAAFRQGRSEYEIHMAYLSAIGDRETQLPYSNIIALNENAAVLHHMSLSTSRPSHSRSFLIDAGASCRAYGSDISRTYTQDNSHSEFIALIDGVDKLQQELVDEVQPGKKYSDIHHSAHRRIAGLLCDAGLLSCSKDEAYESELTLPFFPHGIGHLLGVQTHDRGGYLSSPEGAVDLPPEKHGALRCTRNIEEGMTFTIEPGVYFIPSLLASLEGNSAVNHQLVSELIPYGGIRIEDNVLAKSDSVENYTRMAFDSY